MDRSYKQFILSLHLYLALYYPFFSTLYYSKDIHELYTVVLHCVIYFMLQCYMFLERTFLSWYNLLPIRLLINRVCLNKKYECT